MTDRQKRFAYGTALTAGVAGAVLGARARHQAATIAAWRAKLPKLAAAVEAMRAVPKNQLGAPPKRAMDLRAIRKGAVKMLQPTLPSGRPAGPPLFHSSSMDRRHLDRLHGQLSRGGKFTPKNVDRMMAQLQAMRVPDPRRGKREPLNPVGIRHVGGRSSTRLPEPPEWSKK